MHKRLQWDFFAQEFPREIAEDYVLGDEESATCPPLNFGEAIIVLPGTEANEDQIGRFFRISTMVSLVILGLGYPILMKITSSPFSSILPIVI
jgi:hypothetical protein